MSDLANGVREFVESGIRPVSVAEIQERAQSQVGMRPRARNRTSLVGGAFALAVVMVIVLAVVLPGGSPGAPSSAAAAELNKLAVQANDQGTTLAQNQYAYTRIETQTQTLNGRTPKGSVIHEYLNGTVETWVNSEGTGRMVIISNPTPQFYTPADKKAWEQEGSPPAIAPTNTLRQVYPIGPTAGPSDAQAPLYQVASLPTDPAQLSELLRSGGSGVPDFPSTQCQSSNCRVFADAIDLLVGPDVGMTPQLRGGLFSVLATVPGVSEEKAATDRYGNMGTAFTYVEASPASQLRTICGSSSQSTLTNIPALTTTYKVFVNPTSGAAVGTEQSTSPDLVPPPPIACSNEPTSGLAFIAPRWSAIANEGITQSEVSTPNATSTSGGSQGS
jgi:hypothetical protein